MANSITHKLTSCIKNARFTVEFEFRSSGNGILTTPVSGVAKFSTDGTYPTGLCTESVSASGGLGFFTLTGAETNTKSLTVAIESNNCFTSVVDITTYNGPIVSTGTLSLGASTSGILGTILGYDIAGCWLLTTSGTGGGGVGGSNNQCRRILSYNIATGGFTCDNWEISPSGDTTYSIILPEGMTLGMLKTLNPANPGDTLKVSGVNYYLANSGGILFNNQVFNNTGQTTNLPSDLQTVKTQSVTCSTGITVYPFVGNTGSVINGSAVNTLTSHDPGTTLGTSNLSSNVWTTGLANIISLLPSSVLQAGNIDGYNLQESQRLILSATAGKVSGGGTTTNTFRSASDSKNRIIATVDSSGNRTAITLDAT